jgi:hypothetical protein
LRQGWWRSSCQEKVVSNARIGQLSRRARCYTAVARWRLFDDA